MTRACPPCLLLPSLLWLLAGCERSPQIVEPSASPNAGAPTMATHSFSEWSPAVNLGPTVNSAFVDNLPELSKDGTSLYFTSSRPGGQGGLDLWVARRATVDAPWEPPINLGAPVNSEANDAAPNLSRDGHYLFFTSNRPGGLGSNDIWVSWRADVNDDSGWQAPVNLGAPINGPAFDAGAVLRQPELYFTRGPSAGRLDIYASTVAGERVSEPRVVRELSSDANDQRPTLRYDRREIFFSSNRPAGAGSDDIWSATRPGADAAWQEPVSLGRGINTEHVEAQPGLSEDGMLLFFTSNRPGGSGGLDLYVSRRSRPTSAPN